MDDRGSAVVKEFEELEGGRGTWDQHFKEVAELVLPSHSELFQSYGIQEAGEKRTEKLFDSTAPVSVTRFGSILDSLLTPANQRWHRLMPSDPALERNRLARLWFEEATRILFRYRYAPEANFASQNSQVYMSLGGFGNGCLFIDENKDAGGLRYKAPHLSQTYFSENHQGSVDKVHRRQWFTVRQLHQRSKWAERLPDEVKGKLEKSPEERMEVLHCVKTNPEFEFGRKNYKGKKFISYYVLRQTKTVLEEGGYNSFPYAVSRYTQLSGEIYGRSPAMEVLASIKTLNLEKKTVLKQGQRIVDPIFLAHDDGIMDTFNARPGALIAGGVNKEGRPLVSTLPTGNVNVGKDLMNDEQMLIKDVFLINLFQILVENPQMTATEVLERTKEKGILITPTLGRQQSEYLGPMIERELDLLSLQGLLPPMPPILMDAQGEYSIKYDSPLSRFQAAEETVSLLRTVERVIGIVNATQDTSHLDHFNWERIVPEISQNEGVPEKWMASPEMIERVRQARAQQMQQQQEIQAAPAAAAMMKAEAAQKKAGA